MFTVIHQGLHFISLKPQDFDSQKLKISNSNTNPHLTCLGKDLKPRRRVSFKSKFLWPLTYCAYQNKRGVSKSLHSIHVDDTIRTFESRR